MYCHSELNSIFNLNLGICFETELNEVQRKLNFVQIGVFGIESSAQLRDYSRRVEKEGNVEENNRESA